MRAFIKLWYELYVTADRDIRRSDDSNKYEGVRQLGIIKY